MRRDPSDGERAAAVSAGLERAWAAYEEGDWEAVMAEVSGVLRRDRGNADALLLQAVARLDQGEPADQVLVDLQRAEGAGDPALLHLYRGLALYELARVEEARDEFREAMRLEPEWCEAHYEMGRVLDHLGDEAGARRHYLRARELHPEDHLPPLEMSDAEFDRLVQEALKELPVEVRRKLREVPVLVEASPPDSVLRASDPPIAPDLLGLFVGRNLIERSSADLPGPPEAIYLFRRNLLRVCQSRKELAQEVRTTVRHEVGHLLGADEQTLDEWGIG